MFEKIIKQNSAKISEEIKFDDFILFKDLMNELILKEPYRTFIKASVDCWIYEDELLRKANKSFNFDSLEEINKQINDIYFENFKLSSDELDKLIAYAVKIRLNYLLRPYFTLNWFIFKEDETKNISEVKRKLSFFVDYSYLLSGLNKLLDDKQKSKEIISKIEFAKKLESIDKDKLLTFSADEYEILFKPIFEFFNIDNQEFKEIKIPVEALIIFLQDKGLDRLATNLKSDAENNSKKEYNLQEFFIVVAENNNENELITTTEIANRTEEGIDSPQELEELSTNSDNDLDDIRQKLNALFE